MVLSIEKDIHNCCFGPFVRYEYFPVLIGQKKEEKEENPKKKEEEEIKNNNYKNREEKTQHNLSHTITTVHLIPSHKSRHLLFLKARMKYSETSVN